jgi:hypothetical protein
MADDYDFEKLKRAYMEMARRARETDEDMGLSRGWTTELPEDMQEPAERERRRRHPA